MPTFSIRVVNRDFANSSEHELPSMEAARAEGLKGALHIGVQEVCGGTPFFAAEISIENEHEPTERMMVAVGASSLR